MIAACETRQLVDLGPGGSGNIRLHRRMRRPRVDHAFEFINKKSLECGYRLVFSLENARMCYARPEGTLFAFLLSFCTERFRFAEQSFAKPPCRNDSETQLWFIYLFLERFRFVVKIGSVILFHFLTPFAIVTERLFMSNQPLTRLVYDFSIIQYILINYKLIHTCTRPERLGCLRALWYR